MWKTQSVQSWAAKNTQHVLCVTKGTVLCACSSGLLLVSCWPSGSSFWLFFRLGPGSLPASLGCSKELETDLQLFKSSSPKCSCWLAAQSFCVWATAEWSIALKGAAEHLVVHVGRASHLTDFPEFLECHNHEPLKKLMVARSVLYCGLP